jgi:hypothetical protein
VDRWEHRGTPNDPLSFPAAPGLAEKAGFRGER